MASASAYQAGGVAASAAKYEEKRKLAAIIESSQRK